MSNRETVARPPRYRRRMAERAVVGESRVERWEKRSEWPMLLLAVAFIVAYAWPVLDQNLDQSWQTFLVGVSWTVWLAFAVDFAIRLALSTDRGRYALRHWYDVALVVLPLLRPLRLLRLLALVRVLDRSASNSFAGRVLVYIAGATVLVVALGGIAVLDAEQGVRDANITNLGDALWWATTTVTTVGYGDHFPVSTEGRLVAAVLMLFGISLVGAVTASVASWMLTRAAAERREQDHPDV